MGKTKDSVKFNDWLCTNGWKNDVIKDMQNISAIKVQFFTKGKIKNSIFVPVTDPCFYKIVGNALEFLEDNFK